VIALLEPNERDSRSSARRVVRASQVQTAGACSAPASIGRISTTAGFRSFGIAADLAG